MTREEAFAKAFAQLGLRAVVGVNAQKHNKYYVGAQVQGDWVCYGSGASWEEAFQNIKRRK